MFTFNDHTLLHMGFTRLYIYQIGSEKTTFSRRNIKRREWLGYRGFSQGQERTWKKKNCPYLINFSSEAE